MADKASVSGKVNAMHKAVSVADSTVSYTSK